MGTEESDSTAHAWFCAVSHSPGHHDRVSALHPDGAVSITFPETGELEISARGTHFLDPGTGPESFRLLGPVPRLHERELNAQETHGLLADGPERLLAGVLPPFAAVRWDRTNGLLAAVDRLGLRHLYHKRTPWEAGIATCPLALVRNGPFELDRIALGSQALLGWQLGDRSPIEGVRVVAPGAVVRLHEGRLRGLPPATSPGRSSPDGGRDPIDLDTAVRQGAVLLRYWMESFLEEHPEAVLQLSGGLDSRVLLGAVPPARRRHLSVLTMGRPGDPDLDIATALADRYGMDHRIIDNGGLEDLSPQRAHAMVRAAARGLNCSGDPLSQAANAWAESRSGAPLRLAGVGGEASRGFYYTGRPRSVPVTRRRVERLAALRLFTHASVPTVCLDPGFAEDARETTLRDLQDLLTSSGHDWPTATDGFCLRQFERRWAGLLATSTCFERRTVDPLLDDRLLALAGRLQPQDKHGGRFFSRLVEALDEDLARIPMDGRPAPRVYARPTVRNRARVACATGTTILGRVRRRVLGHGTPPMGTPVLAALLAEHYRERPETLERVGELQIFRPDWLEELARGTTGLPPAAAAMLVNLETLLSRRTVPVGS